ncbi:DUF6279 family lipoprotein [Noviherbaspirillum autotrophicum]|uniref:DUF6279 family lipoprotein n=1 Tax=Noviherbaspirillum autotrophicum TaxID=709839 RepID=UPI000A04337D|nr:DUF6279 family lipoprotein [Noviherbaspirillum autotrophicum]
MRSWRDFFAKVSVFALACLLAGCSALRLGYANGESVVYWWLDSYVDFTSEQKPWVKNQLRQLFAWHRTTQLADYARLLAQAQQTLQRPVTPADALEEYAALKKRAMLGTDKALPALADLALSLQPAQIDHLAKKFASNNEKYRKDTLQGDVEDRQRFRFKKFMKQAEYWFGDFSAQQEAQLRAASNARPLNNELWMADRLQRQQELIRLLRKIQAERPGREVVMAMLRSYIASVFNIFTYDEHKAFFDASQDAHARLIALMVNAATPQQKAHAAKRLQSLIDDCRTLAAH